MTHVSSQINLGSCKRLELRRPKNGRLKMSINKENTGHSVCLAPIPMQISVKYEGSMINQKRHDR